MTATTTRDGLLIRLDDGRTVTVRDGLALLYLPDGDDTPDASVWVPDTTLGDVSDVLDYVADWLRTLEG